MNYQKSIKFMTALATGLMCLSFNIVIDEVSFVSPGKVEAAEQSLFPPAKIAGHVYQHGRVIKDVNNYHLVWVLKGKKSRCEIDGKGRYSLLIPSNAANAGDKIKITLYHANKPILTRNLRVPEAGTMTITNFKF
jgi:hypothetical protein